MYSATENNPRDKFKKPVYWLVALVFLSFLIPWQRMPDLWYARWEQVKRDAFFDAKAVDEAWAKYDEVSARAGVKDNAYSPEDFFQDRCILVPLREKFARAVGFTGKSKYPQRNIISLSKMADGLLESLYQKAEDNFPRFSQKVSRQEGLRNQEEWRRAESETPMPQGCEPIKISGWALLRFCKWIAVCYLKFLPFALVLILFQLWRKKQSLWQEIVLRPRFFFFKVLQGPIGVAIYAGVKPAVEWQYAKLSAQYIKQTGKWRLSEEEEKHFWLEACKQAEITPEIIAYRSKLALATGYLLVIISAPFMALSATGFQQKPVEQTSIQAIHGQDQDQDKEQKEPSQQLFVHAILPEKVKLRVYFEPVARVEQEILPVLVAEKRWFLPPSLAPPLSRR